MAAFVQSIAADNIGATVAATLPAAPTAGNLLVAYVAQQATTNTFTPGSGWSALTAVGSGDNGRMFWKIAGAGESATQAPCTTDSTSRRWVCIVAEYSGVSASSTLLAESAVADGLATRTSPTVTPASGVPAVLIGAVVASTATTTFSGQAVNGSTAGVTERQDLGTGSGGNQTHACLWDLMVASTSGSYTTTATGTIADSGGTAIALFRGVAAASPGQGSATAPFAVTTTAAGSKPTAGTATAPFAVTASASGSKTTTSGGAGVAIQGTPTVYEDNATTTSAVVAVPAGVAPGELLYAQVAHSNQTAPAVPSGWTLIRQQNGAEGLSPSMMACYRWATGSEPASYTFTVASGGRSTAIMLRVSGVDPTTPLDTTAVGAAVPTQTTFDMPSITTVTANALLLHGITLNASASADIATLAGTTLVAKSTGTGRRSGVWSEPRPTAGATGTRTWSNTPATTLQWDGITTALRPAPGSGTTPAGSATATFTVTATAAGKRAPQGTRTAAWSVTATASGKRAPQGTRTAGFSVTATAVGAAPTVGARTGSATATLSVTATAIGSKPAVSTALPIRAAFYYPWFTGGSTPGYPGAWHQGTYPWTQFHPKRGYYDSATTAVIDAHIADMVYGKFGAGIASWWGAGSREDGVIQALLDRAQASGTGFKWCLYYEMEGNAVGGSAGSPNPTIAQITADLDYISTHYTGHPSYLHVNGKPVIFVYGGPEDDNTVTTAITGRSAYRWYQAVRQTTQPWYTVLKVYAGWETDDATYPSDSWHQYGPATAVDVQGSKARTISPRFHRGDNAAPFLPQLSRTTWQQNVRDLVAGAQDWKLVTSYNEWGEGHSVEAATGPSSADPGTNPNRVYAGTGWDSPTGYGWFLDDLHNDGVAGAGPYFGTATATLSVTASATGAKPSAGPSKIAPPPLNTGTSHNTSTATSASISLPAATAGNILVLAAAFDKSSGTITGPTGAGAPRYSYVSSSVSMAVWVWQATGGETTHAFSWATATQHSAWAAEYPASAFTVGTTTGADTGSSSLTTLAVPAATGGSGFALSFFALDSSTSGWDTSPATPSAGWSVRYTNPGSSGNAGLVVAERATNSGDSVPVTWTSATADQLTACIIPLAGTMAAQGSATIVSLWNGGATTSSAQVVVKTSGHATDQARLAYSTNADMSGAQFTAWVTPDAQGMSRHSLTGLSAGTVYHYRVEVGAFRYGGGQLRTMPTGAVSFGFAFASCRSTLNASAHYATIVGRNPAFYHHTGDIQYEDVNSTDPNAYRTVYDTVLGVAAFANLLKSTSTVYNWDDHDFCGNNSRASSTGKDAACQVYRERVPHVTLPSTTGGIQQTWTAGRVRFITLDTRSQRGANGTTMLGAEQKAWLLGLLAAETLPLTFICTSVPWTAAVEAGSDDWSLFPVERQEIGDAIAASATSVVLYSGDMHALAADDGSNDPTGNGIPIIHAASLGRQNSYKGGPYSQGTWPTFTAGVADFAATDNYGWVDVVDDGSAITWTFSGIDGGGVTRVALSGSTEPPVRSGSATGSFTVTATAAGKRTPKATGTAPFAVTATAAGKRSPQATATAAISVTAAASGQRTPKATATGGFAVTATGAGKRAPAGAGTATWAVTASAAGAAPVVGAKQGSALGTWSVTATAAGKRTPKASATTTWSVTATATGLRPILGVGTATAPWSATGAARGAKGLPVPWIPSEPWKGTDPWPGPHSSGGVATATFAVTAQAFGPEPEQDTDHYGYAALSGAQLTTAVLVGAQLTTAVLHGAQVTTAVLASDGTSAAELAGAQVATAVLAGQVTATAEFVGDGTSTAQLVDPVGGGAAL